VEPDGFACIRAGGTTRVKWADVKEIVAFKEDLFAYDLICLAFRVSDNDEWYKIDEEMEGFGEILDPLSEAFPGIPDCWYQDVMHPAFATNAAVLWPPERQARAKP
jgi:hypothetical protein